MKSFVSLTIFLLTRLFAFSANNDNRIDTILPESKIIVPIQINLKAIYNLAERNINTVFTSPNYPRDWVQADCGTRYKYRFRRSPLRLNQPEQRWIYLLRVLPAYWFYQGVLKWHRYFSMDAGLQLWI
jgi:hypothetical protein